MGKLLLENAHFLFLLITLIMLIKCLYQLLAVYLKKFNKKKTPEIA